MIDQKIETLLAVAECKNFTKAAAKLSLTQPAVSHHISLLEKELGSSIFIRQKNGLKLTDSGKIVVKYAKRMVALEDGLRRTLADQEKHITRLRIGITHTAESNLVAEVLAQYGSENPDIMITIMTHSIKNLYTKLENYELDLAIVEGTPSSPNVNSLLLDTDYLVCAVSNDNPVSRQAMITIEQLREQRMILRLPKSGTVSLLASSLESINRSLDEFNIILEVDNIATIKDLILKNMGVSILPVSTCQEEIRRGRMAVLPIENMSMVRETNLVYLKDFSHTEILQRITELYRHTLHNKTNRQKNEEAQTDAELAKRLSELEE